MLFPAESIRESHRRLQSSLRIGLNLPESLHQKSKMVSSYFKLHVTVQFKKVQIAILNCARPTLDNLGIGEFMPTGTSIISAGNAPGISFGMVVSESK